MHNQSENTAQDRSTTPTPLQSQASERCDLELAALAEIVSERRQSLGISEPIDRRLRPAPDPPAMIEKERAERENREAKRREAEVLNDRFSRWSSLIQHRGSRYEDCRLSNFSVGCDKQRRVVEQLRTYCAEVSQRVREGEGVVLFGPRGTGKDHLAMAICRCLVRSDIRVRWQNGMDLFGDIRDAMDDGEGLTERSLVDRLVRPDVLYLSDPLPPIGVLTQFQASMLFRILDGRYSRKKPILCTVNVSGGEELDERMGPQNGDRLRDGALALFCSWSSHRKARA